VVFSPHRVDPVQRIYDLKREIAEARRALSPLMAALPEFEAQADDERNERRAWTWLDNVQSTVDRLDRHLAGHDELLRDMLSAHLAQVSVRQNEDMRKISAWAAMIAVPTLIVGIYGMNFHHMPELGWTLGYPLALVFMAGICLWLYRAFRKSGWL
jgi:magnesium transporter